MDDRYQLAVDVACVLIEQGREAAGMPPFDPCHLAGHANRIVREVDEGTRAERSQ